MPWVPIHQSGLDYELVAGSPSFVSMADSIITSAVSEVGEITSWYLELNGVMPAFRVTVLSYEAFDGGFGITAPSAFTYGELGQQNESVTPESSFEPSPIEIGPPEDGGVFSLTYEAPVGEEWLVSDAYQFLIEVWQDDPPPPVDECNYNCECEDEYPTRTLAQMREFLMIRLGWAAMKDTPLPGVNDTLNAFLNDAQDQLHAEYRLPRLERFFTWNMEAGVRFYDLLENRDTCTKKLDPRQLTWVGISDGCDEWRKLVCGIPPESYYGDVTGMPSRYEIRQCIEVWPPPSDTNWKLRIKGYFYSKTMAEDSDVATLDYNAVQLFALANAKAHYGQQDAANVMRQAMRYVGNMTAGAHHTRRYVPGSSEWVAPPLPVLTGWPGDP